MMKPLALDGSRFLEVKVAHSSIAVVPVVQRRHNLQAF